MTIRTFFYIFLIISIIITKSNSFAEWLANQYCDRQLIVGEVIMNQEVELNNNRKVLVYRNDIELQSGTYHNYYNHHIHYQDYYYHHNHHHNHHNHYNHQE